MINFYPLKGPSNYPIPTTTLILIVKLSLRQSRGTYTHIVQSYPPRSIKKKKYLPYNPIFLSEFSRSNELRNLFRRLCLMTPPPFPYPILRVLPPYSAAC